MIQNKYYDTESSDVKKYDVTKIYATAEQMSKLSGAIDKKIVLMVNNKEALDTKISKNINKHLIYKIYGVKQIEDWFRQLLNELEQTPDIDAFLIAKRGNKPNNNANASR